MRYGIEGQIRECRGSQQRGRLSRCLHGRERTGAAGTQWLHRGATAPEKSQVPADEQADSTYRKRRNAS
jgi:hypothetical protein